MPARRSGLGRGLGALIPQAEPLERGALREIPLARIRANPLQPRKQFDEDALSSLVDSIRVVGVLQPVLVREVGDDEYELIAGERRFRAARRAGLQVLPALVQAADNAASLEQALIENLHREDLNALEEAAAYRQLIEEFELTHEQVAQRVGRSRTAVTNALRLLQLSPKVQGMLRDRSLSAGHARALLALPDREVQEELAQRVLDQGLSVRVLEDLIREVQRGEEEWAASLGPAPDQPPAAGVATGSDGEGNAPAASRTDANALASPVGQRQDLSPVSASAPPSSAPAGADPDATRQPVARDAGDGLRSGAAGDEDDPPAVPALRPPGVLELEELLADHLNTRVRVDMGAKHGRVVIEFADLEDLERIYRLMIAD